MSLNHSPKIVTNGLIFYYDMNNFQKSGKGRPVTNQFTLPTSDTNGFGVQNSTFTRVRSGTYGGYDILPTDYVWQYNISTTDCPYHGWDIPTTAGAVVTFSFDYYVSPTTASYPITNYLANFENAGSGVSGGYTDPTPSITGIWKRASFSATATATGNSRCLLYPGSCGGQLGTSGFILYKNPQVEFNAPSNVPTPFVAGTRSDTQAVLDLTGGTTLTVSNLSYASDNTFSFNGTTSKISAATSLFNKVDGNPLTVAVWMKPGRNAGQYQDILVNRSDTSYNWMLYQHTTDGSIQLHGSAQNKSTYIPTLNEWIHVVATVSTSGTYNLYVNGVVQQTVTGFTYSPATPSLLGIGMFGTSSEPYLGSISAAQIYNRELTAGEVQQNFNARIGMYRTTIGSHSSYPAPSGYYIAQNYPSYPSGYYWIQSSSMPAPLRMYVDMSQEGGGYDFYPITGTGTSIGAVNATHSGTALGLDLVYPRSKQHWIAMSNYVRNVLGSTNNEYFQTMYAIHRTTNAGNGGSGNYTGSIMRDPGYYGTGAPDWKVPDGGRWWLRDTVYTEPNGDYTAYNFLGGFSLANPYTGTDIQYNDVTPQTYVTGGYYLVSTNAKP